MGRLQRPCLAVIHLVERTSAFIVVSTLKTFINNDQILIPTDICRSTWDRIHGLMGRRHYERALLIPRCNSVHTFFMRFPIDVAFLTRDLVVLDIVHMVPWRIGYPRLRARYVLEAEIGYFDGWQIRPGVRLFYDQ